DRNVSMALTPSPTTSVSNPSPRRTMVSISASAASSSTTRIFGVMVTTCVGVYVGAGAGDLPEETLPGRPLGPGHGAGSGALSAGGTTTRSANRSTSGSAPRTVHGDLQPTAASRRYARPVAAWSTLSRS